MKTKNIKLIVAATNIIITNIMGYLVGCYKPGILHP